MPTARGDVLIFATAHSLTIYAVGLAHEDGQQDLGPLTEVQHEHDCAAATALAKGMVAPGAGLFY